MEYEDHLRTEHVASEQLRRHFLEEDRHKQKVRLMLIAGVTLSIVVAIVVILADLGLL